MNKELEAQVQALYNRTDKSVPYEKFAEAYGPSKDTTNFDALFSRTAKHIKLDETPKMDFSKARPAESNLTADQAKAFKERQSAMGIPTADSPRLALAKEKVAEIEAKLATYTYMSAKGVEGQRQILLAKAKEELSNPHREKFNSLKQSFGEETFNISYEKFASLTDKQRADAELDLAIAIKNKKIQCPAGYTPVKCTLLDEIRRERNW